MSTFVSRISPMTGKQEWLLQDENYDYNQEIARSGYADMLHDTERNQKYYEALRKAIQTMHDRGIPANVLDIGTGTGLLSMMAVCCKADSVTACEAFKPMADCAKQIIHDNGFSDKIRVIPKRSTSLTVGPGGDLPSRANILVTEVFDTELIGEGAIGVFQHAHEKLLQRDCIVVPNAANVYAQVVEYDQGRRWKTLLPLTLPNGTSLKAPAEIDKCPGGVAVHDLQLQQVPQSDFMAISHPVKVFRFDFGRRSDSHKDSCQKSIKALSGGRCDAVFMWWDLEMDVDDKIQLSCAPCWAHPEPDDLQWRDHWMQAVYYPREQTLVEKGQEFTLCSSHDGYSLWFDIWTGDKKMDETYKDAPMCNCGLHVTCSHTRLGLMNDEDRNQKLIQVLQETVNEDSVCLSVSDGSLLPFMAAKLGAKKVFALETHQTRRNFLEAYAKVNGLSDRVVFLQKRPEELISSDVAESKINLILGEPFFAAATLPWHNLCFWYSRTELEDVLDSAVMTVPCQASFKAVAVNFEDLWKIRVPVGKCEGFDMTRFDNLIHKGCESTDAYLEPQPLWEYPGFPLTEEFDILSLDFTQPLNSIKTMEREGFVEFLSSGSCNGVAVWMEYRLGKDTSISSGLVEPVTFGKHLKWDIHTRQGVHLFPSPVQINIAGTDKKWLLKHKLIFKPASGEIDIKFSVHSE